VQTIDTKRFIITVEVVPQSWAPNVAGLFDPIRVRCGPI